MFSILSIKIQTTLHRFILPENLASKILSWKKVRTLIGFELTSSEYKKAGTKFDHSCYKKFGDYLKTIKLYLVPSTNVKAGFPLGTFIGYNRFDVKLKAGFHFKNKVAQICEIEIDC